MKLSYSLTLLNQRLLKKKNIKHNFLVAPSSGSEFGQYITADPLYSIFKFKNWNSFTGLTLKSSASSDKLHKKTYQSLSVCACTSCQG